MQQFNQGAKPLIFKVPRLLQACCSNAAGNARAAETFHKCKLIFLRIVFELFLCRTIAPSVLFNTR